MKPDEARRLHVALEERKSLAQKRTMAQLFSDLGDDLPSPELVPTPEDKTVTLRTYRRHVRLAAGYTGEKRDRELDRAVVELARLIWIERVLALDPFERAALTPGRLVMLSRVDPEELRRRLDALQDGSEA